MMISDDAQLHRYAVRHILGSIILACSCCVVVGCAKATKEVALTGEALGTFYSVRIPILPQGITPTDIETWVRGTLDRIDGLMSTYREDSELSRFNQHHSTSPFQVSEETYNVIQIAQQVSEESDGFFDITVGPLVNTWGFGPETPASVPEESQINHLLERVGYKKLILMPDHFLAKMHPDLYCDLSAIAKGYAVDAIAQMFETKGILRYMIEVGGEVRTSGKNSRNTAWALGIEKPTAGPRQLYTIVMMENGALATSGNYRNWYEINGQIVTHTINPHTGYPTTHSLASASVIHPSCTYADAYATALMASGPERAKSLAQKLNLPVLLLEHGPTKDSFVEFSTPSFDAYRKK